jgi:hypothetical protein
MCHLQATVHIASPDSISELEAKTAHLRKIADVLRDHAALQKLREQIARCRRLEQFATDDDFRSRLRAYLSDLEAQSQTMLQSKQARSG